MSQTYVLFQPSIGSSISKSLQELLHAFKLSRPSHILVEKALLPRLVAAIKMLPALQAVPALHVWDSDEAEPGVAQILRVEHIIQHGTAQFEPRVLPVGLAEKQLAFICFSSGTSGMVKGVQLSHGNIVANIFMQSQGLRGMFAPDTVVALIVPFFHILGLAGFSCQYVCQVSRFPETSTRTGVNAGVRVRLLSCFEDLILSLFCTPSKDIKVGGSQIQLR